VKKGEKIH